MDLIKYLRNLEELETELGGVTGVVTALQVAYSDDDVMLTAKALAAYFYGVQTHLERITADISSIVQNMYDEARRGDVA